MGNLLAKHHADDKKSKKLRGKHRKRGGRDRQEHRKHHRDKHSKHDDYHGNRDMYTRWSGHPSDTKDYYHPRHPPSGYNPYYYGHTSSRNWHHDYFRPAMTTVAEQRHKPSSSGSYVSSHQHLKVPYAHRYESNHRGLPPSPLPVSEISGHHRRLLSSSRRKQFSGSRRHYNADSHRKPFSETRSSLKGYHGQYSSPHRERRIPSSIPGSEAHDSKRKRGMIVYRNGKEEKVKRLDSDDNNSWGSSVGKTDKTNTIHRAYPDDKRNSAESEASKNCSHHKLEVKNDIVNNLVDQTKKLETREPLTVTHEKKTIISKFWDSPLGKKLPIGGPLAWFRSKKLHPVNEKAFISQSMCVIPSKPRNIWSGLKRKFIWNYTSLRRRPCSRHPDGQEAEPQIKVTPPSAPSCEPRSVSRFAPSRQFVWKTASSPVKNLSDEEVEVINLSSPKNLPGTPLPNNVADDVFEEEIIPKASVRPNSPFFASRFTWRSSNTKPAKQQAWGQGVAYRNKIFPNLYEEANCSPTQRNTRSYLWRSNNFQHPKNAVDSAWMSESMLYHH